MDEIRESLPLFDKSGMTVNEGWARHPYWTYPIPEKRMRLRHNGWDRYSITDTEKSITLSATYAVIAHEGIYSITYLDYAKSYSNAISSTKILNRLSDTDVIDSPLSDGGLSFFDSSMVISFVRKSTDSYMLVTAPAMPYYEGIGIKLDATIHGYDGGECLSSVLSLKQNGRGFIYSIKEAALPASGNFFFSDRITPMKGIAFREFIRSSGKSRGVVTSISINAVTACGNIGITINDGDGIMNAVFSNGQFRKIEKCNLRHSENKWIVDDEENTVSLSMNDDTAFPIPDYKGNDRIGSKGIAGIFTGTVMLNDGRIAIIDKGFGEIFQVIWKEAK